MAHVPKVAPDPSPLQPVDGPTRPPGAPAALGDRELVTRAQREDKEAFEELIRRHQQRVFAVAARILRKREDIEDISQQVFVKAYFSLKRFDQRAAFSTWLYKITVNECWDLLRKKKVRPLLYDADLSEEQSQQLTAAEGTQSTGPDILQRLATRQRVQQLLSGLDERDRMMLILKEVEGLSIEEIGETMDINANTVKVRLFRARRKIVLSARQKAKEK
ncbi:MAG: sigma-70 family RNA polymerase sigma factor [Candidatus Acidiferrum sp.]|jgi:RNA polymerase sigma-70 factor (ECF subfamily)